MMTKALKYLPLLFILFVSSCYNDNTLPPKEPPVVVPGDDDTKRHSREAAYVELYERFDDEMWFTSVIPYSSSLEVTFSDGEELLFDRNSGVVICEKGEWPLIAVQNGVWYVDGESTHIYEDAETPAVVALIYDGDRLFAWLHDGSIIFFAPDEVPEIGCFFFNRNNNPSLPTSILGQISENSVKVRMPIEVSASGLFATVAVRGNSLKVDDSFFYNGLTSYDYTGGATFSYKNFSDLSRSFTLSVDRYLYAIPTIGIYTDSGLEVSTRSAYVGAKLKVTDADMYFTTTDYQEITTEIRGRGNSSWSMPKKPYKVKLTDKQRLLGMANSRHYALIANYSDKTLFRNAIAFEISKIAGELLWTPDYRFVEVSMNGNYRGLYMLVESCRVAKERVNINVSEEGVVESDYYLGVDSRLGKPVYFYTARSLPVVFDEPEAPTSAQQTYVKNLFNNAETLLYAADPSKSGYSKYIDIKSFASYFIVQELAKNIDGNMRLSTYLAVENGVIKQANVWDFDLAFGNCNYFTSEYRTTNDYRNFHIKSSTWYIQLFKDPAFVAEVKRQWAAVYASIPELEGFIDRTALLLDEGQKRNFQRWNIMGYYVWPNEYVGYTYASEVTYLKTFLRNRADWLNTEIGKL